MYKSEKLSLGMAFLAVVFLLCSPILAETYYVSLKGDDSNDGKTPTTAFRTIAKGVSVLKAGDTLIIKSGNYGNERVRVLRSGTKDAPITIKAEEPGKVILKGTGGGAGISIINKSYIIVEGIKFTNYGVGVLIKYKSTNNIVRKCIFLENNGAGVLLYGNKRSPTDSHSHLFTHNQFIDYTDKQDYGLQLYFSTNVQAVHNYFYGWHHQALSFKKIMSNSLAAYNTFDGFRFTAIYLGQNDDGREGNLRSKNLIAEYNVFRPAAKFRAKNAIVIANVSDPIVRYNFVDSIWGGDVDLHDKTKNVGETNNFPCAGIHIAPNTTGAKIYGNVIINAKKPGILVRTGDCEIYNNTVVGCDWGLAIVPGAHPVVRNNIFYKNKVQVVSPPPRMETWGKVEHTVRMLPDGTLWKWKPEVGKKTVYEHNCWYPKWDGMGKTDISVEPKFVGPFKPLTPVSKPTPQFNPDFSRALPYRLQKTSPCIDKGMNVGLKFIGKAPDIGAFEFGMSRFPKFSS